jgi:WD40 repeat protein
MPSPRFDHDFENDVFISYCHVDDETDASGRRWVSRFEHDLQTQLSQNSGRTTVRVWDLRQPNAAPQVLSGHLSAVMSVAFAPGGNRLASASYDGTVRLWDLRQPNAAPQVLFGHQGSVTSVAFAPDGNHLASASWDGTVRVWPLWSAADHLCTRAWRNLSMDEWRFYIGDGIPYERTCPNLPPGTGAPGGPK